MSEAPQQLGRYELLHRIAKGGMGEIFLAKARGAGGFEKNVILKTILPHLAEEQEFIEKFLDEGRIVVQLIHGNIVPVFDMGEQDGVYFIAMEYVPGRDLREVIQRLDITRTCLPVDLALFVGSEISKGLDYAHRKTDESGVSLGIIHRDISPSNVLISSDGEVKLIDFGIARAAGRLAKTVSGRIQGKFCYMSPEQASGKPMDARSDVFSAGITIYEMLTGFRPFEGSTDLESLDLVRKCEFDPPSTLNAEIPDEVDAIVQKALARDPEDRYPSAERLQVEILQYLYSTGTSPTSSDVARFLHGAFPEGLERIELKSARGSGSGSKNQKLNLNDALEQELERMLNPGIAADIDPHSTTAIKPHGVLTPTTADFRPALTDEAEGLPVTPTQPLLQTDEASRPAHRRSIWPPILVVLVVGTLLMFWVNNEPSGSVSVDSDPSGAQVTIDGADMIGVLTPASFDLETGTHVVTLAKDGFKPRTLRLDVHSDRISRIDAASAQLEPVRGPHKFTLLAPEGASIVRDQHPLGGSPQIIELNPNQVANVRADKDGCTSSNYTVSYDHGEKTIPLPLDCPGEIESPLKEEPPRIIDAVAVGPVSLSFETTPPGARAFVDGKELGLTPISAVFKADQVIAIRLEKDGFVTSTMRERVSKWRNRRVNVDLKPAELGCLDLSLVNPALGDVTIDGAEPRKVSRGIRKWPLSVGKHTIRMHNEAAHRDDTFVIDVKSGDTCSLVVWE
jgi:serine/threonine protein kinase